MADQPEDPEPLPRVIRAFKRNASRLRDVLTGPPESLSVGFSLEASRGGPTTSSTTQGESVPRVAALLRPFMAPGSALELRAVWPRLVDTGVLSEARRQEINEAFARADELS